MVVSTGRFLSHVIFSNRLRPKVYQDVTPAAIHFPPMSRLWVDKTTPWKHTRNAKKTCTWKKSCFLKNGRVFKPSMMQKWRDGWVGQCCSYSLVRIAPGCLRKFGPVVSELQSHWYVGCKPVFPFYNFLGYISCRMHFECRRKWHCCSAENVGLQDAWTPRLLTYGTSRSFWTALPWSYCWKKSC